MSAIDDLIEDAKWGRVGCVLDLSAVETELAQLREDSVRYRLLLDRAQAAATKRLARVDLLTIFEATGWLR